MTVHVQLNPGERLDDLLTHGLQIIQSREVFSFSLDAVLLARFFHVPPRGQIADLCSGTGVIPLLLSTRTKAHIKALEIMPRLAEMARRSVQLNRLEAQIEVLTGDLRASEADSPLASGVFDAVTVNPPYLPLQTGDVSDNRYVAGARHELDCTLAEVVQCAARLLRSGGKLAIVHRPARLAELLTCLARNRLQVKRMQFVHPHVDAEANMVLVEAHKDGKPELRLLPPHILSN